MGAPCRVVPGRVHSLSRGAAACRPRRASRRAGLPATVRSRGKHPATVPRRGERRDRRRDLVRHRLTVVLCRRVALAHRTRGARRRGRAADLALRRVRAGPERAARGCRLRRVPRGQVRPRGARRHGRAPARRRGGGRPAAPRPARARTAPQHVPGPPPARRRARGGRGRGRASSCSRRCSSASASACSRRTGRAGRTSATARCSSASPRRPACPRSGWWPPSTTTSPRRRCGWTRPGGQARHPRRAHVRVRPPVRGERRADAGRARRRRPPRPLRRLTARRLAAAPPPRAARATRASIVARGARTYHWAVRGAPQGRRGRTVRSGPSTLPLEGGSRRASARTGAEEAA